MMELFGVMPDSEPVSRITLNHGRLLISILTYCATLQDLRPPVSATSLQRDERYHEVSTFTFID